ncbi:MAG: hypothetical protein NTW56_00865 [Alphaproteobacteria bacterium]|nr:hypothetical protein [Alphaproteobacteria bacterium]
MTPTPRLRPWVPNPALPGAMSRGARAAARWALIYLPFALNEAQRAFLVEVLTARRIEPEAAVRVFTLLNRATRQRDQRT